MGINGRVLGNGTAIHFPTETRGRKNLSAETRSRTRTPAVPPILEGI
jgi:hypothetical protein